jgi:hypothetical protein
MVARLELDINTGETMGVKCSEEEREALDAIIDELARVHEACTGLSERLHSVGPSGVTWMQSWAPALATILVLDLQLRHAARKSIAAAEALRVYAS